MATVDTYREEPSARTVGAVLAAATERISAAGVEDARTDATVLIADALGVTKAAVYHQYNTKDEIVLAVAEVVLARLDAAATAAEAERSRARGREVLIAAMIDLAVERRRMASILQRDPVMLRFLEQHRPFRQVMTRVNRLLIGGAVDPRGRVQAAMLAVAIAGAVIHPLVVDLDDDSLRAHLLAQARRLLR